jgi:hypothetical protein
MSQAYMPQRDPRLERLMRLREIFMRGVMPGYAEPPWQRPGMGQPDFRTQPVRPMPDRYTLPPGYSEVPRPTPTMPDRYTLPPGYSPQPAPPPSNPYPGVRPMPGIIDLPPKRSTQPPKQNVRNIVPKQNPNLSRPTTEFRTQPYPY